MDAGLSKRFLAILKKQGMEFSLRAKVVGATVTKDGVTVEYEDMEANQKSAVQGDVVLISTGRRPFADGLGLENVGVERDSRGYVVVDATYRTRVPNIFAVGDLINTPMLAHVAEEEAVAAVEIMAGMPGHVNYDAVPGIVYTWPEFAAVGKTEEQLKAEGIPYKVGTFPFTPNGRAKALGSTEGQCKILAHAETDRILGAHIVGPRAGDLIQEAVIAIEFGGAAEDLARSFHGHPTLSEVVREAALDVDKRVRQM
jgi:dihydrolipoamide dehydrogenase